MEEEKQDHQHEGLPQRVFAHIKPHVNANTLIGVLTIVLTVGFGIVDYESGKKAREFAASVEATNLSKELEKPLQECPPGDNHATCAKEQKTRKARVLKAFSLTQRNNEYMSDLSYAVLNDLIGIDVYFPDNFRFEGAQIKNFGALAISASHAKLNSSNISESNLINSRLPRVNASKSTAANTMFSHSDMTGCTLDNADLTGAKFFNTNLSGCTMKNTDLSNSVFLKASYKRSGRSVVILVDMKGANLSGAKLYGADLSGANLSDANLSGATYDEETVFPRGLEPQERGMVKLPPIIAAQ